MQFRNRFSWPWVGLATILLGSLFLILMTPRIKHEGDFMPSKEQKVSLAGKKVFVELSPTGVEKEDLLKEVIRYQIEYLGGIQVYAEEPDAIKLKIKGYQIRFEQNGFGQVHHLINAEFDGCVASSGGGNPADSMIQIFRDCAAQKKSAAETLR